MELHQLFQKQYTQLEETIDSVAERINKLGSQTFGTMKEFISSSRIKELPGVYPIQKDMLKELLKDHESMSKQIRKDIDTCGVKYKDAGTTDFITGILEIHETTSWILRRYLS